MENWLGIILVFVILPLAVIGYTLYLISGKGNKSYYMIDHIYAGRVYVAIPAGIAFLIFGLAAIPESPDVSLNIIGVGLVIGVIGLAFGFTQPSFLKPPWLRWLEREHSELMPFLRKEANRMGLNVWNKRIQSQEDLEDWVEEVRDKYRL